MLSKTLTCCATRYRTMQIAPHQSVLPAFAAQRYYATYARRADWSQVWRHEMLKAEKLQKSLAVWVPKMVRTHDTRTRTLLSSLHLVFALPRRSQPTRG